VLSESHKEKNQSSTQAAKGTSNFKNIIYAQYLS